MRGTLVRAAADQRQADIRLDSVGQRKQLLDNILKEQLDAQHIQQRSRRRRQLGFNQLVVDRLEFSWFGFNLLGFNWIGQIN